MNMQYVAALNALAQIQGLVDSTVKQFGELQDKFDLLNTKVDQLQERFNDGFEYINDRFEYINETIADIKADIGIHVDVIGGY